MFSQSEAKKLGQSMTMQNDNATYVKQKKTEEEDRMMAGVVW